MCCCKELKDKNSWGQIPSLVWTFPSGSAFFSHSKIFLMLMSKTPELQPSVYLLPEDGNP